MPGKQVRTSRRKALHRRQRGEDAGVRHFIWSMLPNVETISGGTIDVPHFTAKANVERIVSEARFAHHTFVIAPFYYENLLGVMAPQKQADGTVGLALPLDPERRVIHMATSLSSAASWSARSAQPELGLGHGEHSPSVGDFLSFNEIVTTLSRQEYKGLVQQVPREVFAGCSPGAEDIAAMLAYFEAHTYLGLGIARRDRTRQQGRWPATDHVSAWSRPLRAPYSRLTCSKCNPSRARKSDEPNSCPHRRGRTQLAIAPASAKDCQSSPTGRPLNLHAQMAHSPAVLAAYASLRAVIAEHGALDRKVSWGTKSRNGGHGRQRLHDWVLASRFARMNGWSEPRSPPCGQARRRATPRSTR